MGLEFCVSSLVFRGAGFWLYTNFIRESVKEHLGFFPLIQRQDRWERKTRYTDLFGEALLGVTISAVSFVSMGMGKNCIMATRRQDLVRQLKKAKQYQNVDTTSRGRPSPLVKSKSSDETTNALSCTWRRITDTDGGLSVKTRAVGDGGPKPSQAPASTIRCRRAAMEARHHDITAGTEMREAG